MLSLLIFLLTTYGLCFLAADAKIFGCPVTDFAEDPTDFDYIESAGIWRIRQRLLRYNFFQQLLKCYFCLGIWMGMVAHWLLLAYCHTNPNWCSSYFLAGPMDPFNLAVGSIIAALVGATGAFMIDAVLRWLEKAN